MGVWTSVLVVAAVLAAATGAGLVLRARNGAFRDVSGASAGGKAVREAGGKGGREAGGKGGREAGGKGDGEGPTPGAMLARLGVTADTPVTLLQFSSAFCAPCRTTRVLCADVAQRVPGVRHVEVDAESHLEAVRALDVWRTPTVLIIDSRGRVARRATGAPTRPQLLAAVGDLLPHSDVGTSPARR